MKTEITKDALLKAGWVDIKDGMGFHMEKPLENINPINDDPEDTGIKLILHSMFNTPQFAVLMPDGGMLNMYFDSMEELNRFEEQVQFYDCPY